MAYPPTYRQRNNFEAEARAGRDVDGSQLHAEFAYVAQSVNALLHFIRTFVLPNGNINTHQTLAVNDMVDEIEHTVSADGEDTFATLNEYSTLDDYVRVWRNDVFVPVTEYTADGTQVQFAAPAPTQSGDVVRIRVYLGLKTALEASTMWLASEDGAASVGIDDIEGRFTGSDVNTALQEVAAGLADLVAEFNSRADYVLTDGTQELSGNWEANPRSDVIPPAEPATGSFDFINFCSNGDTLTLNDGSTSRTFQFTNDASSLVGGNIQVLIGANDDDQADKFIASLGTQPLAISATKSTGAGFTTINLVHNVPGVVGNQPLAKSSSAITNVVGMTGGIDEASVEALAAFWRIRNLPRAIREGDPVVYEQLREVQTNLNNLGIDFVRTDGSSTMDGNFDFGNNRGINLGAAQNGTEATNLDQVTAAIDALDAALTAYVDQEVGNLGSGLSAYLNRTTGTDGMERNLPMGGYTVENVYAVAINNPPMAAEHATRKDYVDGADAGLQAQIDAISAPVGAWSDTVCLASEAFYNSTPGSTELINEGYSHNHYVQADVLQAAQRIVTPVSPALPLNGAYLSDGYDAVNANPGRQVGIRSIGVTDFGASGLRTYSQFQYARYCMMVGVMDDADGYLKGKMANIYDIVANGTSCTIKWCEQMVFQLSLPTTGQAVLPNDDVWYDVYTVANASSEYAKIQARYNGAHVYFRTIAYCNGFVSDSAFAFVNFNALGLN